MGFGDQAYDPYALRDPYEKGAAPSPGGGSAYGGRGNAPFDGASHGAATAGQRGGGFGNKHLAVALAVALLLLVAAGACAYSVLRAPDISAYANEEVVIVGLADEEFSVTSADLATMKCSQLTAEGQGKGQNGESKAGTVTGYGPTLKRFLEAYGYKPADFDRIVVTCSDGYKVTIHGDMLEGTILLSIAQGKAALDDFHQPMRLVMPAEESGKWCYGICRIEFEVLSDEEEAAVAEGVGAVTEEDAVAEAGSPEEAVGDGASTDGGSSASAGSSGTSFGNL